MNSDFSGYVTFRIDPSLSGDVRRLLDGVLIEFKNSEILELKEWYPTDSGRLTVDFISENSLHLLKMGSHLKFCVLDQNQGLFSYGQNLESSGIDAVLDALVDFNQLVRLIQPSLQGIMSGQETSLTTVGIKNLRKVESRARILTQKASATSDSMTSESLLAYAQALVDLEKEMIHSDDISKLEKILRHFLKNNIEKTKFQFFTPDKTWAIETSKNFLALPRYKNQFLALELNWEDEDYFRFIKKFFFLYTVISFFQSQQDIQDPFFDEKLWEGALDSIPFPVALLTESGELCQHNSLFAKLNFPPVDCLKVGLREKILINDIPYNIFKKNIFHLDEQKILFVFFTESFFLKGDGNLTPSGQELGIISSSIAHELNNPIAGIQAALTLIMLDQELNEEAMQTLVEMKNGAIRCKQLIETFLGFSRANPTTLPNIDASIGPIEICYGQAQNLLRFRTVESGIRFHFEYSRHTNFRSTVNVSLLTMTFYLILGELMTLYSHQLLVANRNQIEKVIKGELIESSQEIQIQLLELNISTLSLSKLIQNLLTIENFVLQVSDYSLRFIYNPPKE